MNLHSKSAVIAGAAAPCKNARGSTLHQFEREAVDGGLGI